MTKLISYLGIIGWSIYLMIRIHREVNTSKNKLKLDSIIFFIVYLIYRYFIREEVLLFLYIVIIITLLVYTIYDLIDNYTFKLNKKNIIYYLIGLIIIIGTFLYYRYNDIYSMIILTFIINIILPFTVSFVKFLKKN